MSKWDWEAEGYKEIPEGHTLHPDHVKAMREGQERAGNLPTTEVNNDMLVEVALIPTTLAMMPFNYLNYILTGKKPNG